MRAVWYALIGSFVLVALAMLQKLPDVLVRFSQLHCTGQSALVGGHATSLNNVTPMGPSKLVVKTYKLLPALVSELMKYYHPGATDIPGAAVLEHPEQITEHFRSKQAWIQRTKEVLDHHTSDKARIHKYHLFYAAMLENFSSIGPVNTLEIGLGTVNMKSRSNGTYRNGGSLRAFRDLLPEARVYGADVSKPSLFQEERIATHWADQLDRDSMRAMLKAFGNPKFDLIIDDGAHVIVTCMNVLLFALEHVKQNGWVVIEDIDHGSVDFWKSFVDPVLRTNPNFRTALTHTDFWCYIVHKLK